MVVEASDITPEEDTGLLDSDADPPDDEVNEVNAPLLDYLEEENLDPNEEVSNDAQVAQQRCNPRVTLVWRVPPVRFPWHELSSSLLM